MLQYLLEKEFKQFLRNSFLPKMVIALPFVSLAVFPFIANMDVKNISLAVVDNDLSQISRQMQEKIVSSGNFHISGYFDNTEAAMKSIERGSSDILLEIPQKFQQSLLRENLGNVMISANTVNVMKGGLGSACLTNIIADFNGDLIAKQLPETANAKPAIEVRPLFRFNPNLNYRAFMIPALVAMMLILICGFLPHSVFFQHFCFTVCCPEVQFC